MIMVRVAGGIVRGVRLLQMPPQMDEQGDRHAHYDQRTDA